MYHWDQPFHDLPRSRQRQAYTCRCLGAQHATRLSTSIKTADPLSVYALLSWFTITSGLYNARGIRFPCSYIRSPAYVGKDVEYIYIIFFRGHYCCMQYVQYLNIKLNSTCHICIMTLRPHVNREESSNCDKLVQLLK